MLSSVRFTSKPFCHPLQHKWINHDNHQGFIANKGTGDAISTTSHQDNYQTSAKTLLNCNHDQRLEWWCCQAKLLPTHPRPIANQDRSASHNISLRHHNHSKSYPHQAQHFFVTKQPRSTMPMAITIAKKKKQAPYRFGARHCKVCLNPRW